MRTTKSHQRRWVNVLIGGAIALMVILQLLPFYITSTTAFKPKTDLSSRWIFPTDTFTGQNFITAIKDGNILTSIYNSTLITVVATLLVCFIAAMAGYPLARRPTQPNAGILTGFIGLMMIPPLSVLVPLYTTMRTIGGLNTYWGIIVVMVAGNLPILVFLYASFMRNLPLSIEEAAAVDGVSSMGILFRIVFPMLKPVTATVIILVSAGMWNEYALSNYLLRASDMRTIAPAIANFIGSTGSNPGAAAAAAMISVVPILVVYFALQKYFVKGIVAGSEK